MRPIFDLERANTTRKGRESGKGGDLRTSRSSEKKRRWARSRRREKRASITQTGHATLGPPVGGEGGRSRGRKRRYNRPKRGKGAVQPACLPVAMPRFSARPTGGVTIDPIRDDAQFGTATTLSAAFQAYATPPHGAFYGKGRRDAGTSSGYSRKPGSRQPRPRCKSTPAPCKWGKAPAGKYNDGDPDNRRGLRGRMLRVSAWRRLGKRRKKGRGEGG